MIHSVKFIGVLDTNVIYPIEIRDLLFWFAHYQVLDALRKNGLKQTADYLHTLI